VALLELKHELALILLHPMAELTVAATLQRLVVRRNVNAEKLVPATASVQAQQASAMTTNVPTALAILLKHQLVSVLLVPLMMIVTIVTPVPPTPVIIREQPAPSAVTQTTPLTAVGPMAAGALVLLLAAKAPKPEPPLVSEPAAEEHVRELRLPAKAVIAQVAAEVVFPVFVGLEQVVIISRLI